MRVCEYCGKHNDVSARNCAGCGTKLEAARAVQGTRETADPVNRLLAKCDYAAAVICTFAFLAGCFRYALVVSRTDWERVDSWALALPMMLGIVLVYFRRSHRFARGPVGGTLGRILSSRTARMLGMVLPVAVIFHGLIAGFSAKWSQTREKFVELFICCFFVTAAYWVVRVGALGSAMFPWINRGSQKRGSGSAPVDVKRRKGALMRVLRARERRLKLKEGKG